jgi:hypothetical protein
MKKKRNKKGMDGNNIGVVFDIVEGTTDIIIAKILDLEVRFGKCISGSLYLVVILLIASTTDGQALKLL